jgi:hypothetical protein
MKIKLLLPAGILAVCSCNYPPYIAKFASTECILFDYVRIYPDESADLQFKSIENPANFPTKVRKDSTSYIIKVHDYEFLYRNDTLFEISGRDPGTDFMIGCRLVKVKD